MEASDKLPADAEVENKPEGWYLRARQGDYCTVLFARSGSAGKISDHVSQQCGGRP